MRLAGLEGYDELAHRYLRWADRCLPGRVSGFYVVGSAALGAFRPGRSDLDFVAVVDGGLGARDLRRLRVLQLVTGAGSARRSVPRGMVSLPGTCNGTFVDSAQLHLPVSKIVPAVSHTGGGFSVGRSFDVNPVIWKVFAERGIAIRGPEPGRLGLDPEPDLLRPWTLANLRGYWAKWAEATGRRPHPSYRLRPRWMTAWGVLGAPRLHCTVETGEVISKEAAGEYALATFKNRWRPIVEDALAYWRGQPAPRRLGWQERVQTTAAFVAAVASDVSG